MPSGVATQAKRATEGLSPRRQPRAGEFPCDSAGQAVGRANWRKRMGPSFHGGRLGIYRLLLRRAGRDGRPFFFFIRRRSVPRAGAPCALGIISIEFALHGSVGVEMAGPLCPSRSRRAGVESGGPTWWNGDTGPARNTKTTGEAMVNQLQ